MLKILLTGNKGFIGTEIQKGLASSGIEYIGIDKEDSIPEERFDLILHFGARTLIRKSLEAPYDYFSDNLDLTMRILEKCRIQGSAIVFPTSGSVAEATNPYSLAKRQCTDWVKLYSNLYGVKSYVLKLFNIYGETTRKGAVYLFSQAAVSKTKITLFGDGSHVRDFVHVNDLVNFVLRIVDGQVEPGDYEMGTGRGTSVKQLIKVVEEAAGIKFEVEEQPYVVEEAQELFARKPVISNGITLEEGVSRMIGALHDGVSQNGS